MCHIQLHFSHIWSWYIRRFFNIFLHNQCDICQCSIFLSFCLENAKIVRVYPKTWKFHWRKWVEIFKFQLPSCRAPFSRCLRWAKNLNECILKDNKSIHHRRSFLIKRMNLWKKWIVWYIWFSWKLHHLVSFCQRLWSVCMAIISQTPTMHFNCHFRFGKSEQFISTVSNQSVSESNFQKNLRDLVIVRTGINKIRLLHVRKQLQCE